MAWTNVFTLGACDVYVRFNSAANQTDPTWDKLVPIASLNPAIGVVTVVNNVVNFSFATGSGGGGLQPQIVLVPKFPITTALGSRVSGGPFQRLSVGPFVAGTPNTFTERNGGNNVAGVGTTSDTPRVGDGLAAINNVAGV